MQPLVIKRSVLWGSIIVLIVALICLRLGFWQLDRLQQRRAHNAALESRMRMPPVQLGALISDSAGLVFRRVVLHGEFDDAHTVIIAGRSLRGVPGVHVLTPLRIGGTAVLVNRGWMPSADAARINVDRIREPGPRGLAALITPLPDSYGRGALPDTFQRVWYRMDGRHMIRQFPYPMLPFLAQILPYPNAPQYPIRLRPPEMDEGPHLGYAIQWFSFAIIAIIGWIALAFRSTRRPAAD